MQITRFLRNARVTSSEMIGAAREGTQERVSGRRILAIQDTTTLRDDGDRASIALHPTIAIDADDGALLGLVHAQVLHRHGGRKALRRTVPFAQKESSRWLEGTQAAAGLMAHGACEVTVVADREADIYEAFALRPSGTHLLIRAMQDRRLADDAMLFACVEDLPELGRLDVDLPAAPGRSARTITLALRACPVLIPRPWRAADEAGRLPDKVALWLVDAREVDPPQASQPAQWRLLTTHPVADLAAARRMVLFYRQRWTIEQLFRTMKTKGFDIEHSRVEHTRAFENLATATLIAAVQVLQLVRERDGAAGRPIQDLFDPSDEPAMAKVNAALEGKTDKQKNPHPPGSLAFASWICARLGGWTGYYGKPGPVVILQGLLRLQTMLQGYALHHV
jgi:Transposase DDE domain